MFFWGGGGGAVGVYPSKAQNAVNIQHEITLFHSDKKNHSCCSWTKCHIKNTKLMIRANKNLLKHLGMSCYSCVKKGNKMNCISLNPRSRECRYMV